MLASMADAWRRTLWRALWWLAAELMLLPGGRVGLVAPLPDRASPARDLAVVRCFCSPWMVALVAAGVAWWLLLPVRWWWLASSAQI